jgi:hypothetical protein
MLAVSSPVLQILEKIKQNIPRILAATPATETSE